MSIATLKRKTNVQYNNMSVNQRQFSLNGGYRNQGYVGQNLISRSLPKTPMRGDTMRGSGGCCGTYLTRPPIQSAVTSTEDPSVIKTSVKGTEGMIQEKYRWIRRPPPLSTVKPDDTLNMNTQGQYVHYLENRTLAALKNRTCSSKIIPEADGCCSIQTMYGIEKVPGISEKLGKTTINGTITKTIKKNVQSQSHYLLQLNSGCSSNDVFYVPFNFQGTPFGYGLPGV
jgi:hypothetical protein